jgi:hypothetical protein
MPPYGADSAARQLPRCRRSRQRHARRSRGRCRSTDDPADGGNIALTAASDRFTTAKWSNVLPSGSTGLAAIQVTDFEMVDAGARIPLTYDCVRSPDGLRESARQVERDLRRVGVVSCLMNM